MIENDLPLIPRDSTNSIDNKKLISNKLRITSPLNGDVFKIDPVLRKTYQQIQLTAEVPEHIHQIQWIINGDVFQTVNWPFQTTWQLQPGEYEFQVLAADVRSELTKIFEDAMVYW